MYGFQLNEQRKVSKRATLTTILRIWSSFCHLLDITDWKLHTFESDILNLPASNNWNISDHTVQTNKEEWHNVTSVPLLVQIVCIAENCKNSGEPEHMYK
jgi:hypothetical protein